MKIYEIDLSLMLPGKLWPMNKFFNEAHETIDTKFKEKEVIFGPKTTNIDGQYPSI